MWNCIAPHREDSSKALRCGTHSQGISQFNLHTPHSSTNGMNHTCLIFPAKAGPHLPTAEGWNDSLCNIFVILEPSSFKCPNLTRLLFSPVYIQQGVQKHHTGGTAANSMCHEQTSCLLSVPCSSSTSSDKKTY